MRIDPYLDARISLEVDQRRRSFSDAEHDECPFPGIERRWPRRNGGRPQERCRSHEYGQSQIEVGALKPELHRQSERR